MSGDERCETCRFAEPTIDDIDGPFMQCRRYPPMMIAIGDEERAGQVLPRVEHGDWCGEWQPIEQAEAEADGGGT